MKATNKVAKAQIIVFLSHFFASPSKALACPSKSEVKTPTPALADASLAAVTISAIAPLFSKTSFLLSSRIVFAFNKVFESSSIFF